MNTPEQTDALLYAKAKMHALSYTGATEPKPWQVTTSKPPGYTVPAPHDDNINNKPIPRRSNRRSYRRR